MDSMLAIKIEWYSASSTEVFQQIGATLTLKEPKVTLFWEALRVIIDKFEMWDPSDSLEFFVLNSGSEFRSGWIGANDVNLSSIRYLLCHSEHLLTGRMKLVVNLEGLKNRFYNRLYDLAHPLSLNPVLIR